MEVHSSNLALFEPPPVESAIETVQWIHFAPLVIPKRGAALEYNIPRNSVMYMDLSKTVLQVKVRIRLQDGGDISPDNDVGLVNLALSSIFRQCDVSLYQTTINTSIGSNYSYKSYFDVLLGSTAAEAETVLQNELFYKDTAGAMDGTGLSGNNIGHYDRAVHTQNSKIAVLEGPIRMDICQQERLIVNGVKLKIKLSQMDDAFRLLCGDDKAYKVEIVDSVLKLCQVKLKPQVLVAQNQILTSRNAVYPFWRSDIKTFNMRTGDYECSLEDVYQGSITNEFVLAMCSSEAYSGSFQRNPFNFYHYNLTWLEVTASGSPTPCEPICPNFKLGDFTSCYSTLFNNDQKQPGLIGKKEYPDGYCIFMFRLQSQSGGDLHSAEKEGNLRIAMKFSEPLRENVTVILYAKFPELVTINGSRNIGLPYKRT